MKSFLALFIYRIVLVVLLPLILVYFLLRSRKQPAYRQRLLERLGILFGDYQQGGLVIHAASVGEVLALRPLVERLLNEQPNLNITFTAFTPTGSEQILKFFQSRVQHCYLPLDCFFSSLLFLNKLKPNALIIMETELWPNLIAQAKKRDIKLMIVNGRISPATIKQYQQLSWLFAPTLAKFNKILCQSAENQKHFLQLGATSQAVALSGNIKYDITLPETVLEKQRILTELLPENKTIWVVASTHDTEEALAINAFKRLQADHPDLLLVLVPRHPERFKAVSELAHKTSADNNQLMAVQSRSSNQKVHELTQIWLFDTLGELMALYPLADVVTVAGSFCRIGGHNPLEPAYFKKPIIVGNNMANFNDIMSQLTTNNAIIQLKENTPTALAEHVRQLLTDKAKAAQLGENAYQVVKSNQGAVNFTLIQLVAMLNLVNDHS